MDIADRNKVIAQTITELVEEITESKDASDQPLKVVINVAKSPEIEEIDVSIEQFDKVLLANVTSPGISEDTTGVEIELDKIDELESDIETKLDEIEKIDPISISMPKPKVEITSTKTMTGSTDSSSVRTTSKIEDEDLNKIEINSSTKPNEPIIDEDLNLIEIDEKPTVNSEVTPTTLESNSNVVKPTTPASVAPSEIQSSSTGRSEETTSSTVSRDDDYDDSEFDVGSRSSG